MIKNIAVFASGSGSNFEAIMKNIYLGTLDAKVLLLVTNNPNALVIDRARKYNIQTLVLDSSLFRRRNEHEEIILWELKSYNLDLIVLAGYMKILSSKFIQEVRVPIINIHPSLLPKYKGMKAIERAYNSSERETGVTIHLIDENVDEGIILAQESIKIHENDSFEIVKNRIQRLEHKLYSETLQNIITSQILLETKSVEVK